MSDIMSDIDEYIEMRDRNALIAKVKRLREENSILKNALRSLLKDKHAEVWYEVNRILEGEEE